MGDNNRTPTDVCGEAKVHHDYNANFRFSWHLKPGFHMIATIAAIADRGITKMVQS